MPQEKESHIPLSITFTDGTEYKTTMFLGSGIGGNVYAGKSPSDPELAAIKVSKGIPETDSKGNPIPDPLLSYEYEILKSLGETPGTENHIISVKKLATVTVDGTDARTVLVESLAPGTRLGIILTDPTLEFDDLIQIMYRVAAAVDKVSDASYFDLDFTENSVFIDENGKTPITEDYELNGRAVFIDAGSYVKVTGFDEDGNPILELPPENPEGFPRIAVTLANSSPHILKDYSDEAIAHLTMTELRNAPKWGVMNIIYKRLFQLYPIAGFNENEEYKNTVHGQGSTDPILLRTDHSGKIPQLQGINPMYFCALVHYIDQFPAPKRNAAGLAGLLYTLEQVKDESHKERYQILSQFSNQQIASIYSLFSATMTGITQNQRGDLPVDEIRQSFTEQILPKLNLYLKGKYDNDFSELNKPTINREDYDRIVNTIRSHGNTLGFDELEATEEKPVMTDQEVKLWIQELLTSANKKKVQEVETPEERAEREQDFLEKLLDELSYLWVDVFSADKQLYFETNMDFIDALKRFAKPIEIVD